MSAYREYLLSAVTANDKPEAAIARAWASSPARRESSREHHDSDVRPFGLPEKMPSRSQYRGLTVRSRTLGCVEASTFPAMGLSEWMTMRADGRHRAEHAARQQQKAAAAERAKAEVARQAELSLDPAGRLDLPAWRDALATAGIDRTEIQLLIDACVGEMNGEGTIDDPSAGMRSIDTGLIAITRDRQIVYLHEAMRGIGPSATVRHLDEIRELRQNNTGSECQIRFRNDRFFDGQPGPMHLSDWWGVRIHRNPNIRAEFRELGFPV